MKYTCKGGGGLPSGGQTEFTQHEVAPFFVFFFWSDVMDLEVNGEQTDFLGGSDETDWVSTGAAAPFRRLSLSVSTDSGT